LITGDILLGALALFLLRVINIAISTVNVIVIIREERLAASMPAFFESLIWVVVMASVIQDLTNWLNSWHSAAAAAGNYVGLVIERLISVRGGDITVRTGRHELAVALREQGYAVTESRGEGREGHVILLHVFIARSNLPALLGTVQALNPQTFVSVEEVRPVHLSHRPS
jgi:uncharacterized protein YebE (UPF0316 family)